MLSAALAMTGAAKTNRGEPSALKTAKALRKSAKSIATGVEFTYLKMWGFLA